MRRAPAAAAERVTTIPGAPGPGPSQHGFARQWGLSLALQDVRRVVLSARRQGKRVILGGHSLGASMTVAYASWDFGGRPGYKDLDGLVLIDGGLMGSFSTPDLAATKKAIAALDINGPFADLLGLKLPWATGVFAEVGALAALKEPTAPSAVQSFPLLPPEFKPPIPATKRGAFGVAFDASTSPKALALIHVQAGTLGSNGDWVDGEVSPIQRVAQTRDSQTDHLKLRPWHRREVNLLDPLTAAPDRNRFLKTVVPFLRAVR